VKILVTGGGDFIGSHLCRKLSELGYDLTVIDNLSGGDQHIADLLEEGKAKFILCDVRDSRKLNEAINTAIDSVIGT